MIPWTEHRARILQAARPLPAEEVPLTQARGRTLAADVTTRWPVPLFDNSAMDGYAVRRDDAVEGSELAVVADVPAGSAQDPAIATGQAARIMTGAAVPTQADAIVPIEDVEAGASDAAGVPVSIRIVSPPKPGAHIRREGEDTAAGDVAVSAGTVLGPWQLASIASAGRERVLVHRRPRVAVISTGTELIEPGAEPGRGQIPESNSVLLRALLEQDGYDVASVTWLRDDEGERLARELDDLDADALILSGGASVGAYDVVKEVLAPRGIRFDKVAIQPGKPQGFGTTPQAGGGDALVFCLPGNPVAVAASYAVFVRPALRTLQGAARVLPCTLTLPAGTGWKCPRGRAQVIPVVVQDDAVYPATSGGSGSHLVTSLAAAQTLALVPAETERVQEGDAITVLMPA